MGVFNQMKMAQDMMKNMSPEQMQELMQQAKEQKHELDEQIVKAVAEEIQKRNLVSRDEVLELIKQNTDS